MEYKIVMPRLTDTMEVGKIIRWLKKVGDKVDKNEPIVEVESDKAVMEVPSFQEGILVKILAEEGDEVPVGEPIAILETDETKIQKKIQEKTTEEKSIKKEKKEEIKIETKDITPEILPEGTASPSAKKLAKELGIDIKELQEKGVLPSPAHEKDIKNYFYSQFFTKTALSLAEEYGIPLEDIYSKYKKKIDKKAVLQYIEENNIPRKISIPSVQKTLISNLKKSLEIPTYHIYQEFDFSLIKWDEKKTFTAWFIKVLADEIRENPLIRTVYRGEIFYEYPSVNISVAVDVEGKLYAPVIKQADKKSVSQISQELYTFKEKAKKSEFSIGELTGGVFAVSNLGMTGIDFFDAIIPPEHSGIVAVGREREDKKAVLVFSFDHRVINGKEAAQFVVSLRDRFLNKKYISSLED